MHVSLRRENGVYLYSSKNSVVRCYIASKNLVVLKIKKVLKIYLKFSGALLFYF